MLRDSPLLRTLSSTALSRLAPATGDVPSPAATPRVRADSLADAGQEELPRWSPGSDISMENPIFQGEPLATSAARARAARAPPRGPGLRR